MIRFIMKRRWRSDADSGASGENFITFTADVPELEKHLTSGWMSQYGFECVDLVGAEVIVAEIERLDRLESARETK